MLIGPNKERQFEPSSSLTGKNIKVTYKYNPCQGYPILYIENSPCPSSYQESKVGESMNGNRDANGDPIFKEVSIEFIAYDPGVYSFMADQYGWVCQTTTNCSVELCVHSDVIKVEVDSQIVRNIQHNTTTYTMPGNIDCDINSIDNPQSIDPTNFILLKEGQTFIPNSKPSPPQITVEVCSKLSDALKEKFHYGGVTYRMPVVSGPEGTWDPINFNLSPCVDITNSRFYFQVDNILLPIFSGSCIPSYLTDLGDICENNSELFNKITSEEQFKKLLEDIKAWQTHQKKIQAYAFTFAIDEHELTHYENELKRIKGNIDDVLDDIHDKTFDYTPGGCLIDGVNNYRPEILDMVGDKWIDILKTKLIGEVFEAEEQRARVVDLPLYVALEGCILNWAKTYHSNWLP